MRCTGTCSTAAEHDGPLAQPVADILCRLQIIDAEERLADIGQQGLVLTVREALLQLTKRLVIKNKP